MAKKLIITIARQYGSGGREIGERVAEILDIPMYDKELIKDAAAKGSLNEEVLRTTDESAANSLLYTLAMGSNVLGATMQFGYKMPLNDKLFILQSEVIREYAAAGSCVIIGRCGNYILKDDPDVIKLYIYSDLETSLDRVTELYGMKPSEAKRTIEKIDKSRAAYYEYYTGEDWHDLSNYDLCVNTSGISFENAADIILAYIEKIKN